MKKLIRRVTQSVSFMLNQNNYNPYNIMTTTIEHFYDTLKENEDIVILKIGADWCKACHKIKTLVKNQGWRFTNKCR